MPTIVRFAPAFEKPLKQLSRKFPTVTKVVRELVHQLEAGQRLGERIPNIDYEVYKVRLQNPSAQRGKSGGFRAIYYLEFKDEIYMLTIYSKTDRADISLEEIRLIIQSLSND